MPRSRTSRLALLTVVGALAATAWLAPAASAATQRYASPTGAGTACTSASPCDVVQAVKDANSGDEVIVNPGDYELTDTLINAEPITIHGVAGQPRPRLRFSGKQSGLTLLQGTLLRYVDIVQAAPERNALFAYGARVDQVVMRAPAESGWCTALLDNSTIRNSIVVTTGSGGAAICAFGVTSPYRNVTAIATGSGGVAIEAYAGQSFKTRLELVNVIARGGPGGASFAIRTASGSGTEATIAASHTNWANYWTEGANTQYIDGGDNQGAPPAFADPGAGDYRQAPGSVTINAGLDAPINGAFDVDGDPRTIGTTDIGADEFVVAPTATTGAADAVTDHSATLSASVNANGAPTNYHFEYGTTTAYGSTTPTTGAGSGGAVAAAAALDGLNPGTTYHYRVVATNSGGVNNGADQTFTTGAPTAPSPPTAPTPPTTPPPAQPFAGAKLVSSKLTMAGRFITLRLRCPAATVGHCSGKTKLTARRRRTRSRPTSTVSLGRAGFSIAAGKHTKVRVRVSRPGRWLLRGVRRVRGTVRTAARDGAGQSKTTMAKVTIRRRRG